MTNNKNPLNHNRLKEIRLEKHVTQKELAKLLGVSEQAVAYYEQAKREPPLSTWEKLASFFNIPTSYIMGVSNDSVGWDEWSKNTGYTVQQIKDEINRLIETDRLDKNAGIQIKIGRAVSSLELETMDTTQGIRNVVVEKLMTLEEDINSSMLADPPIYKSQEEMFQWIIRNKTLKLRDDLDIDSLDKMTQIINNAIEEINNIPINNK